MRQSFKVGGITFKTGFGKVITREFISALKLTFNSGDLSAVDEVEYNIIPADSSSGAAFQSVKLTEYYTDVTIEMGSYFTGLYSQTGIYILGIRLSKNNVVVDGHNHSFYFCKYNWYQMGLSMPDKVKSCFSPSVFKYSQTGLHVDTETQTATKVAFDIAGYTEEVRVKDGDVAFDAQLFLRQFFDGIKPWEGTKPVTQFSFATTSPIMVNDSVVIRLINASGKMIGVSEFDLQPWFAVNTLFPDAINSKSDGGKWRKRVLFYNMPMTLDLYQNTAKKNAAGFNYSVGFRLKKFRDNGDGTYSGGGTLNANADGADLTSIYFMTMFDYFNGTSSSTFDRQSMINNGAYLTADNAALTDGSTGDTYGVDITFNASTCGTFCRWISRFGERCYWLFAAGEESFETKAGTTFERVTESFGEEKRTNVETTNIVKIGDVVYKDYVGFLCSFADGWAQQIYDPSTGRWTDIEVIDAKVSVGKKVAGNRVEFEIKKPQKNIVF